MTEKLLPVLPSRKRRKEMERRELLKVGRALIEALPPDLVERYGITVDSYLKIDAREDGFTVKPVPSESKFDDMAWTIQLIEEAQEKQARTPMTIEEELAEEAELATYGEAQAKRLGIKEEGVMDIIYTYREKRQRSQSGA